MYYIYRITNKVNGKTYIGQHKYEDLNDNYMGSGVLLAKAKKKYGKENFEKEILYSRIQYKETVDSMEKFAISKERALGKAEYNIAEGGMGGNGLKGKHFSEDHKRKISKAYEMTDGIRRKLSELKKGEKNPNYGKLGTFTGKHHSEETRKMMEDMREAYKKSGRKDWNVFQKEYRNSHLTIKNKT